jgi:pimeloyl-ACP methyl ester carboxylesterase
MFKEAIKGKEVEAPYLIEDMAEDAFGLLDALGIKKAHVCGASMGGMIAQSMAIKSSSRVLSLTSIMSSPGSLDRHLPKPQAMKVLMTPPPKDVDDYMEYYADTWRVLSGSGFPFDEDAIRERGKLVYERCYYPQGTARQMAAILASPDREVKLSDLEMPVLVIHGDDDPLVPLAYGEETAEAIPGSELLIIEGMGHNLPEGAWSRIIEAITKNARKASH